MLTSRLLLVRAARPPTPFVKWCFCLAVLSSDYPLMFLWPSDPFVGAAAQQLANAFGRADVPALQVLDDETSLIEDVRHAPRPS